MTNFEVYSFSDTLLTVDDPCYLGGGGNPSYIQDSGLANVCFYYLVSALL
jgi:hypothetical protein